MNQQQIKYSMERIEGIHTRAKKAVRNKHTQRGAKLGVKEMLALVIEGKVKMRKYARLDTEFLDFFDFSEHHEKEIADEAQIQFELEALQADVNGLKDEIMLGDAVKALGLLQGFEARYKL